jgi:hypothetical protein
MKNVHFMEIFNKAYSAYHTQHYIVPFHFPEQIELFGKQWEPEDIDALIYVNTMKKKELQEWKKSW